MTRRLALLVAAIVLLAQPAARADVTPPPTSPKGSPVIREPAPNPIELATLQRTMCLGTCPVYKVTIYVDGRVDYFGQAYVKVGGHRVGHATPAELAALRQAFERGSYLKLEDHYDCYDVTDNPSANTSFTVGGKRKAVTHYYGCERAPKTLFTVEDAIDKAAHIEQWIGTEKEREALRKIGKLR